jgi:hypothetical protein
MPELQNYKTHARTDPSMHFFVFPTFILNLLAAIIHTIYYWPLYRYLHLWWIIISIALIIFAFKTRINDLKVQDRIIRLEERLRIASLLSTAEQGRIPELSVRQLIALRFASDAELPGLVRRTLDQNLEPKAIKQAITQWRADNHRV